MDYAQQRPWADYTDQLDISHELTNLPVAIPVTESEVTGTTTLSIHLFGLELIRWTVSSHHKH